LDRKIKSKTILYWKENREKKIVKCRSVGRAVCVNEEKEKKLSGGWSQWNIYNAALDAS